jgi:hypothetical protein
LHQTILSAYIVESDSLVTSRLHVLSYLSTDFSKKKYISISHIIYMLLNMQMWGTA